MNKFNSPRAARNIERMLSLLSKSALSSHEIGIHLHMSGNTVWQYLSYLRSKKKVRISGWTFEAVGDKRPHLRPLYRTGRRPDAPKPPPKSNADIYRDYEKRVMSDPDKYRRGYISITSRYARQMHSNRMKRVPKLVAAGFGNEETAILISGNVLLGEKLRSPTPNQVGEIIRLKESGMSYRSIARIVGTSATTARKYYNHFSQ